jgi:hypothetical protein
MTHLLGVLAEPHRGNRSLRGAVGLDSPLHRSWDLVWRPCKADQHHERHPQPGHPQLGKSHAGWLYFDGTYRDYPAFKRKFASFRANYHLSTLSWFSNSERCACMGRLRHGSCRQRPGDCLGEVGRLVQGRGRIHQGSDAGHQGVNSCLIPYAFLCMRSSPLLPLYS